MRVRGIRWAAVIILSMTVLGPGKARAQAVSKVAFINARAVLAATPGYAQAESTFTNEREAARAEVDRLQATIDSARSDFEQKSVMLSSSARAAKRKELDDQESRAQQRFNQLQDRLAQRERELLEPIQSRVNRVIESIRSAGGYSLIFDVGSGSGMIVAADPALDLTQTVIDKVKAGP